MLRVEHRIVVKGTVDDPVVLEARLSHFIHLVVRPVLVEISPARGVMMALDDVPVELVRADGHLPIEIEEGAHRRRCLEEIARVALQARRPARFLECPAWPAPPLGLENLAHGAARGLGDEVAQPTDLLDAAVVGAGHGAVGGIVLEIDELPARIPCQPPMARIIMRRCLGLLL